MQYYRTQIEDISKKICADMHLAVYDIDEKMSGKGRIIIVYLTKIGGVSLDECARFSRVLGEELETFDLIPERYFLEVSSPGLERPLKLKSHWVSAINEKVAVQFQEEDEKRSVMGTLLEVNQDTVTLDDRGERLQIPLKSISRAKTVFLGLPRGDDDER
ncbi:MAG: ribosome assembly cofactor RimP [Candidatus Cloacimonadaceae bacterium]|nr:ribosome assembly cofactor RimP [Candidatus Cloacimonadota bacterium]MDY0128143.1 ribosome assembly cofactor RimP [Candidatus Cloacimonadaceae bacterium]MCB5254448.1 ribosome assembly cofactor RimP [Candidatus Cloacimonadota bacterium]MCK9178427.1 ribosome assembly cofactor RimP [Candidatus Cloacimonadota bacterium]MCK9242504.1 ribosome assembly cofactor RimP [Candidatus Cloacimonadota bacterium]